MSQEKVCLFWGCFFFSFLWISTLCYSVPKLLFFILLFEKYSYHEIFRHKRRVPSALWYGMCTCYSLNRASLEQNPKPAVHKWEYVVWTLLEAAFLWSWTWLANSSWETLATVSLPCSLHTRSLERAALSCTSELVCVLLFQCPLPPWQSSLPFFPTPGTSDVWTPRLLPQPFQEKSEMLPYFSGHIFQLWDFLFYHCCVPKVFASWMNFRQTSGKGWENKGAFLSVTSFCLKGQQTPSTLCLLCTPCSELVHMC